ncbi:MAG: hypothetical protein PVI26_07975 [Chitinispirillia bacterium]|jgi:hypothetical protein
MESSNTILTFLTGPFFIGLYIGLIGCIVIYIRMVIKGSKLKKEAKKLKEHLHTKLEIDSEANEERKKKMDALKEENSNLRISNQTLASKPGRNEIRQFYVYQKALEIMLETSPGFAPAWQNALREGEAAIEKVDKGFIPFIKKITGGGRTDITPKISDETDNSNRP